MEVLNILLLVFIIGCALSVALSKNLLVSIVIFMSQSLAMSVIWIMLQSPDLAITEAAVGVGIDSLLYLLIQLIHQQFFIQTYHFFRTTFSLLLPMV